MVLYRDPTFASEMLNMAGSGSNEDITNSHHKTSSFSVANQIYRANHISSDAPNLLFTSFAPNDSAISQPNFNHASRILPRREHHATSLPSHLPPLVTENAAASRCESENSQLDDHLSNLDHFTNRIHQLGSLERGDKVPMGPLTSLLQKRPRSPQSRSEDILFLPLPVGKILPPKRAKSCSIDESALNDKEGTAADKVELSDPATTTEITDDMSTASARHSRRQFLRQKSQQSSQKPKTRRPRGRPRLQIFQETSPLATADEHELGPSELIPSSESLCLLEDHDGLTEAVDSRSHLVRFKGTSYTYLRSYLSLCWSGTQKSDDLILGRPGDQLLQKCERLIRTKAVSILEGTDGEALLIIYQDPVTNMFINCPARILPRKVLENTILFHDTQKRNVEIWEKVCRRFFLESRDAPPDFSHSEKPYLLPSNDNNLCEAETVYNFFGTNDESSTRKRDQHQKLLVKEENMLLSYSQFNFTNPLWYYIFRSKSHAKACHRIINALPASFKPQKSFSYAEYVLMPHIVKLMAPGNEALALDSGALFSVLQNQDWNRPINKLFLLMVIRVSVSCYSHRDLLRIMAPRILEFIWGVLVTQPFHLEAQMNCSFINDFCTQDMMRRAAWKAHLIPVQTVCDTRPAYFKDYLHKVADEIQVEAVETSKDGKTPSMLFKNELMNDIRPTLTSHNMALDIFIDLAKSIHPEDTRIGSINALRWARCFDAVVCNSGLTWRNIKLFSVLHRGNYRVAERMTTVYRFGIPVLKLVLWALNALVDEAILTAVPCIDFSPQKLCDCLKMIGYMARDEVTYDLPIERDTEPVQLQAHQFFKILVDEPVVHVMVRYILVAPKIDHDYNYGLVYDHVWWILRKIGFVFPYQVNQLKEIALDGGINIHISGNAALFICVNWLRTNSPELSLGERKTLVETLAMFSLATESSNAKDLLSQLILDISTA